MMLTLKPIDLVDAIAELGSVKEYEYYKGNTSIQITEITRPEGPIRFTRRNLRTPNKAASFGGISTHQLATAALVFSRRPNYPIHFDRLFSGGGNSRSAFESLLALTPHFFICYPKKTNPYTGETETSLKHIMWCPEATHSLGTIDTKEFEQVISEVELDADIGEIRLPPNSLAKEFDSIETKKIHTQMQAALVKIGAALNFRTWIAKNDQSILVDNARLGDLDGVVKTLDNAHILYNAESKQIAALIDCIWFTDDFRYIPAVIEVEHSTGVTSGLTRMLKLHEAIPSVELSNTVVAPNELRNKVVAEANSPVFRKLNARYMPYSSVRELFGLIQRYNLSGVVERNFVEPFMEEVVEE